jgi:ABC-type multidrug transport system ATPase subunit
LNEPVRLENLTIEHRRVPIVRDVSLVVEPGSVYALLGHAGAGKSSLVDVLLGRRKPSGGRALLFGEDSWKKRRRLSGRVGSGADRSGVFPELLVLDDPTPGVVLPAGVAAAFLATADPAAIEGLATRVGVLHKGRLALDAPAAQLAARFRRIRYANRLTETRTAFGTELDAFDAVRVRVRGWGIDAVVSNFDPGEFERFRAIDGVEGAEAMPMSLTEIFHAVAGESPPAAARGAS